MEQGIDRIYSIISSIDYTSKKSPYLKYASAIMAIKDHLESALLEVSRRKEAVNESVAEAVGLQELINDFRNVFEKIEIDWKEAEDSETLQV